MGLHEEVISTITAKPALDSSTVERLTWLMDLVTDASTLLMNAVWTQGTLDQIAGRNYIGKGKVAAQSLGWTVEGPDYIPSRWEWVCKAQVFSLLTPHAQKRAVFAALLADPTVTNAQVSSLCGGYISHSVVSQMRRRIAKSGVAVGTDYTTFSRCPRIGKIIRTSVVDSQVVKINRTTGDLTIKLPLCAHPKSREDWSWVTIAVTLPAYARTMHDGQLTLPTIRLHEGAFSFMYSVKENVEQNTEPASVLGVDWSPSKGAVAVQVRESGSGLTSDYRPHEPSAAVRSMQAKASRLLNQERELGRKIFRIQGLTAGSAPVATKIADLATERRLVAAKRDRLNAHIGWKIAAEFVDHALATGTEMIAVENLSSLQAGGLGRMVNSLVSQSPRAKIASSLAHTSAKVGIRTVLVPPRGTSAQCPVCNTTLLRPTGHYSARCSKGCFNLGDRDVVGAANIAKRGLLGKASINRKKKVAKIRHAPVRKAPRDKHSPTPSQKTRKKVDHAALRRVLRAIHKPEKAYPRYAVALDTCVADVAKVTSLSAACDSTSRHGPGGQPRLSHQVLCK